MTKNQNLAGYNQNFKKCLPNNQHFDRFIDLTEIFNLLSKIFEKL